MTRSHEKMNRLKEAGAEPMVCDVFDLIALRRAVESSRPDLVMHQLTDLPDDVALIGEFAASHNRIRREGTKNLMTAAEAAGVPRFVAQSVAWQLPGDAGAAVADLERLVLDYPGVVIRYGQFYGPDTYHPDEPPDPPRIQVDRAAERTMASLDARPGALTIVES